MAQATRRSQKNKSKSKTSSPKKVKRLKGAGPRSVDRLLQTGGTVTEDLRMLRFAGVALGGGKTDKTAVAVLEYYPDKKRVFLTSLHDKVSGKGSVSADEALADVLLGEKDLTFVAFDAPLQLPKCVRCVLTCPGTEKCREPVIKWMHEAHKKRDRVKRPNKMFTPYTERAAEIFIANELEEPFHPSHALGANAAPLAARAHYLQRRLNLPLIEFYPKLSLWRIGLNLKIQKTHLRFHRHAVDSDEARLEILKKLIEREIAFIYQQDLKVLVENSVAFDAFIGAITAYLKYRGQTEKPPTNFPIGEIWIDFPRTEITWF